MEKVTKRTNYIPWDDYFFGIAALSAMRSKDPSTQVGACIVNEQKKVVGLGYNGFPTGCSDDELPWDRDENLSEYNRKYFYVAHAELNAISNSTTSLENCTIYVNLFPCNECAKLIIQNGIKTVKYLNDKYADTDSVKASKRMLNLASVECIQCTPKNKTLELILDA